jgi:hypothetical protein
MYCPKCGKENPPEAKLCQNCSWVLAGSQPNSPADDAKNSGWAIAAIILAILSFFTFFLTVLPAIICGIIALIKIGISNGLLKGKAMAITGIVLPGVCLVMIAILGVLASILMPALSRIKSQSYQIVCGANMKGLGMAMLVYASDYDEKYPTPEKWCDLLIENADVLEKSLICKGDKVGPSSYAMNKNICMLGPKAPPQMVLLFESMPGWNLVGGPEYLNTGNHNGDGCNILFNDMHVEFVKTDDLNDLAWTPEQCKPRPVRRCNP